MDPLKPGSKFCSIPLEAGGDFLSRRFELDWDAESDVLSLSGEYRLDLSRESSIRLSLNHSQRSDESLEGLSTGGESSFALRRFSTLENSDPARVPNETLRHNEVMKQSSWGSRIASKDAQSSVERNLTVEQRRTYSVDTESKAHQKLQSRRASASCPDFTEIDSFGLEKQKPHSATFIAESSHDSESLKLAGRSTTEMKKKVELERREKPSQRARKNEHVSVYSQNFDVNSRFLSKSYYPSSYWKPKNSVPTSRTPVCSVRIDKRQDNDNRKNIDSELEVIRKKFNTKKFFRSWVWEAEESVLNSYLKKDLVILGLKNKNTVVPSEKNARRRKRDIQLNKSYPAQSKSRKDADSELNNSFLNTITLPFISSSSKANRQKQQTFPTILNDDLVRKYRKQHEDLTKENENNKKKKLPKKSYYT